MRFALYSVTTALLIGFASTTVRHIRHATNSPLASARLLVGGWKNIYVVDFFPDAVQQFSVSLKQEATFWPSVMAFAPPNGLFVVETFDRVLSLLDLDLENDTLTLEAETNTSYSVVDLEFNADKTRLVGCSYGNGTIDVWEVENGRLDLIKTIQSPGISGPDEVYQASPHPRQANLDPTGRFFAINDLGTDSIIIIDTKDGAYDITNNIYITPSGCGPSVGAFYPRGVHMATHYIVVCGLRNEVIVYSLRYREVHLEMEKTQTIPGPGDAFPPQTVRAITAVNILLTVDNKHLYISKCVKDNTIDPIAHYTVAPNNLTHKMLNLTSKASAGGSCPARVSLSENNEYVFASDPTDQFRLAALKRNVDGTLQRSPIASIMKPAFGDEEFQPSFVQQIVLPQMPLEPLFDNTTSTEGYD
ncbi:Lactonase, 7-bladed beta-propeller-domain-containing protein [Dactylonectria estremocensis]|uniref:Lactonase, 7-bladed beta-propeller-domain-containing protein n=1 Tax=Dactylonectria estremocensis TaxID=1079267 RepID=A0A9P9D4U9_9HYPO|nr:Lactonase, 7-bladed beta-propeller-domain-containing protein [Dactylonectria estremocensis]